MSGVCRNLLRHGEQVLSRHGGIRCASSLPRGFNPRGSIVAPFTPFKTDGDVDLNRLPDYIKHMKKYGVPSVFVNGTTGEGLSMTVNERKEVAEAWLENKHNFEHIIFHIGGGNLRESQELARHCEEKGADSIACISPSYFKPQKVEDLVEYMSLVASSAPNTPFYLYDINFMTYVYMDNIRFLEIAGGKIPNLVGIKHSSPEFNSLMRCHRLAKEKYHILLGSDDTMLPSLSMGIPDSVPNSFMAPLHNKIRDAYEKGDMESARDAQLKTMQISAIRAKHAQGAGVFTASRAMMKMLGCDLGPPRLPLTALDKDKYQALEKELKEFGFFDLLP